MGKGAGSPTVKPKSTATDDEDQEKVPGKEASKPDPWHSKEARRQRVSRLEKLLQLAEQNEYPEGNIEEIRGKLKAATKLMAGCSKIR